MMKVWRPDAKEIESTSDWGIWSKEASIFPWQYDETETCLILSGEAEVTDNKGNKIQFKEGDMVRFDRGVECTWNIKRDITKRYQFG